MDKESVAVSVTVAGTQSTPPPSPNRGQRVAKSPVVLVTRREGKGEQRDKREKANIPQRVKEAQDVYMWLVALLSVLVGIASLFFILK